MQQSIDINDVSRDLELPFYGLNSTGIQSFFYCDLGKPKFEYLMNKKNDEGDEISLIGAVEGSKTLS